MRRPALVLLALTLVLLQSCSFARSVRVANYCPVPVVLSFFGGRVPPADWGTGTTVEAGKEIVLDNALPGKGGDVGLARIEYPDGSSRILQIGETEEDPVRLAVQGALCRA